MIGDQKYKVAVTFTFEAPVFEEDPNDLFELADLEEKSIVSAILSTFTDSEVSEIEVTALAGE